MRPFHSGDIGFPDPHDVDVIAQAPALIIERLERDGINLNASAEAVAAGHEDHAHPVLMRIVGIEQRTGHAICQIVMRTGRVINRIPSASRRPPFETAQLIDQTRVVEQFDTAGIEQRKSIAIESPAKRSPCTRLMPYVFNVAESSAITCSGLNGGRISRTQSSTKLSPSRWLMANATESDEPPLGSVKAV